MAAKKCIAKCLVCKGMKLYREKPESDEDSAKNRKALEYFTAAIEKDGGTLIAYKFAAKLNFDEENYEIAAGQYNLINNMIRAETCYKKVCESDPENMEKLVQLADYQVGIGLYNDAKRTVMEAIQVCSGDNSDHEFDEGKCQILFWKLEEIRKIE